MKKPKKKLYDPSISYEDYEDKPSKPMPSASSFYKSKNMQTSIDPKAPSGVSELPWTVEEDKVSKAFWIYSPVRRDVCDLYNRVDGKCVRYENAEANAAFIVHAVNNHAGLVDVIEKVLFEYKHRGYITNLSVSVMKKALKNAKGKK